MPKTCNQLDVITDKRAGRPLVHPVKAFTVYSAEVNYYIVHSHPRCLSPHARGNVAFFLPYGLGVDRRCRKLGVA